MTYKKVIKEWGLPLIFAIILVVLIRKFLFFSVIIPSPSMYPTIKVEDRLIVTRIHNKSNIKRGDIVVFYSKEFKEDFIKRVIGLPGDTIDIDYDGQVFVNGKKLNEPYVLNKDNFSGNFKVPANSYFFLGDNRSSSKDSRYWDNPYIEKKDIKGKAQFILYPFKRFGKFTIGTEALNR